MIGRITVAASAVAAAQAYTCKPPTDPAVAALYKINDAQAGDHENDTGKSTLAITCETDAKRSDANTAPAIDFDSCTEDLKSYTLTGCVKVNVDTVFECKAPTLVADGSAYTLKGVSPALTDMKSNVINKDLFNCPADQEAADGIKVTACTENDKPYTLSGCREAKVAKCQLPEKHTNFVLANGETIDTLVDLTKSVIDELDKDSFKCINTKEGPIAFTTCAEDGQKFTLTGCDTDVQEENDQDDESNQENDEEEGFTCMVPDNSKMYTFNKIVVAANHTSTDGFFQANSTANPAVFECADKYVRTNTTAAPKVTVCGEKDTEFKLSGCEAKKVTAFKPQPSSAFTAAATGAVLRTAVVVMSAVMYLKM